MAARAFALALVVGAVALAAGCGGGSGGSGSTSGGVSSKDVPANAVAIVAGTPIPRTEFERFFSQAEQAYKSQGRTFPKAGTPEYSQLQNQAVQYLVQRAEFAKEAKTLGVAVTRAEVTKKLDDLKNQYFAGSDTKYQAELKKEGLTDADIKSDLEAQLISQKIYDKVTKGKTVTDQQVRQYYDQHTKQFATPDSRDVAHILVGSKTLADKLYKELQNGADFAALAKKYSTDKGSAKSGGELTDQKGSFVPEFEKVAFSLDTGQIGKPVKSQYGWHIIKALADTKPGKTASFSGVKSQIRQQLQKTTRDKAMNGWVAEVEAKYAPRVAYAVGFAAPSTSANANAGTTSP